MPASTRTRPVLHYNDGTLSPLQENFIDHILAGMTVFTAAKAISVCRTTVYQWMGDSKFKAELDRRRDEIRTKSRDRLLKLCGKAVDTVETAVKNGDVRVALSVLKGLGVLDGNGLQPIVAQTVNHQTNVQMNLDNAPPEEILRLKRLMDDIRRKATGGETSQDAISQPSPHSLHSEPVQP